MSNEDFHRELNRPTPLQRWLLGALLVLALVSMLAGISSDRVPPRAVEVAKADSAGARGEATPPASPAPALVAVTGSGSYPVDGSGAVNAARLRNGGSIPSRATVELTSRGSNADLAASRTSEATGAYTPEPVRWIRLRLKRDDRVIVARMCVNERASHLWSARGELLPDCLAIMQTVYDLAAAKRWEHGYTVHRLSPRVAGDKPATRRRQLVNRALPAQGMDPPLEWRDDLDGNWEEVSGPAWVKLRDAVIRVSARGFAAPYPDRRVVAWGCPEDDAKAVRRGLQRADTDEDATANNVWALPRGGRLLRSGHVVAARLASGR